MRVASVEVVGLTFVDMSYLVSLIIPDFWK